MIPDKRIEAGDAASTVRRIGGLRMSCREMVIGEGESGIRMRLQGGPIDFRAVDDRYSRRA